MKKCYSFLFTALLFSWQVSRAQNDTLLFENFENDPESYIPMTFSSGNDETWINYDADGYNDASGTDRPAEWFLTTGFADADVDDYIYASNSWTTPAEPVANYLILPPLQIIDNTAQLSWKSAPYQTPRYLDGYYVVVSTDCNTEECFTDTVFRAAEYLSAGSLDADSGFSHYEFSPGWIHGEDGTYIEYHADSARFIGILQPQSVSLAGYAGKTIYIAIVHGTQDDNLLSVDDILVTGTEVTGIDEVNDQASINIFPNPASTTAVIHFYQEKTSSITTRIYDVTGRLVKSVNSGVMIKGHQQLTMDVSSLAKGIYNVVIEAGKSKLVEKLAVE